jgi:subfamily B ATP-binding cassette protein MsbA
LKGLSRILKYVFPLYTKNAVIYLVFNIISVVFSLFSIVMIIPFLDVLFGNQNLVTVKPIFEFNQEAISAYFNFYLSKVVLEFGPSRGLMFIMAFVVTTTFFKASFFYLAKYFMVPVNVGVVRDIRDNMYNKILKLPLSYYSNERKGDIISRMTSDISEIELSVVRSVEVLLKEPVTILLYLGFLVYLSPELSIFVLLMFPISGAIIGKIGGTLRKSSNRAQTILGDLISRIEETLGGLRIIKAFNAHNKSNERFQEVNHEYSNIMIRMWRRRDLAVPLSEFLGILTVAIVLWYGGIIVLGGKGDLTSESLIAYLAVFSQIIAPAKAFTNAFYNIQKGLAASDRINKVLDSEINILDKPNAIDIEGFNSEITYDNLYFKYKDDFVINGIDLKIKKGQTVALVGQSGSGKTTMVDLLPRFYDVTKGSITIDGIDIRDVRVDKLRGLMGIVNQESILFNDTIFNNIAFGVENATMEQVIEAAKIANAHSFILETPYGYETNIGDRGGNLSGGQRQRLSIARAVLANPSIMIFDEATSALDTESEKLVQDSLNRLMENRTSIVIAHRLSTVIHADVICVMYEGKIVEQGNHPELIEQDGYYKKLHDAQAFA